MAQERERLKSELRRFADILLQDAEKTFSFLEKIVKDGKWNYRKDATIEDCHLEQILSSVTPLETYETVLKEIDACCLAIGLPPLRFTFKIVGGLRFFISLLSNQANTPPTATDRVLSSPRLLIEAITNLYGNFCLAYSNLPVQRETLEVFRREVFSQLGEYNKDIDRAGQTLAPQAEGKALETTPQRSNEASEEYDVFLCHASEDKDSFVRPLAQTLRDRGLRVWYDEFSLKLGDGLRESIERGLKKSRYGVIVLSKNFFCKEWPQKELNGLFSLESGEKKILPVWHEVNKKEVTEYSPILANRVAIKTSKGLTDVAEKIIEVACIGAS